MLETHVECGKFENFNNRFREFYTKWKPAVRNSQYGRAIGGHVIGIRKNLTELGVKHIIKSYSETDVMVVNIGSTEFTFIPTVCKLGR